MRRGIVIALLLSILLPPAPAKTADISSLTLPNGLEVITFDSHNIPLVTICMVVRMGAFVETPEYNGLSHLCEHMHIIGGNRTTPTEEETKERLRKLGTEIGGLTNAFTDIESTVYWLTLPRGNLEEGMEFLKDIIVFPLFDPQELSEEKRVVLAEYDIHDANPLDYFQRKVRESLFYEYPSRVDILGDRAVIVTASREKLLELKERYYLPNNSVLVITGDIDTSGAGRLAEGVFGDWPRGDDPWVKYPVPHYPLLVQPQALIVVRPVSTITLRLSFQGPCTSQDEKATYTSDVFCAILNNPSSSFQKSLVDSGPFSYVSVSRLVYRYCGMVDIVAQTDRENFPEARKALLREVQKLSHPSYFTGEEMEVAQSRLEVQLNYDREKPSKFASFLGQRWCISSLDYYLNYAQNIQQVNRRAMERFIDTYITDQPFVLGVLLSDEDQRALKLKQKDLLCSER